jgi:pimeloyl-ACP methyl ester carboxylesterase
LSRPEHRWGVRGALKVDGRAVHYRRAGKTGAPAVLLLHGSPESASALHGVAAALDDRFDVIAIDTPGNGLSEPLAEPQPDSEAFARHALAVLDAFGIERAGLYGFHTGAGTAMSAALIAPARITALALDGYAVWTEAEREALLRDYCVVYAPVWDGSHLARIWARLEEQLIFFPWHDRRLAARMDLPPTPMETRLRRLRDWLTAWESYPAAYRSAFRRAGEVGPDRTAVPTLIGAMARDPLDAHLDRLTDVSPAVRLQHWGEDRETALSDIAEHLSAHPGSSATCDPHHPALLESLAAPQAAEGWAPDDHGGFLLQLWTQLRGEALCAARTEAQLAEGLDPRRLHARVTAAVQAHTGL